MIIQQYLFHDSVLVIPSCLIAMLFQVNLKFSTWISDCV
jgi:hypothetical protein